MVDFKIRRGYSSTVFIAPNVVNPRLVIEEGCWYLCIDTAELFLGVMAESGALILKRINEVKSEVSDEKFQAALQALDQKVATLETLELYQKINNEGELPSNFNSETFNPNITYYIPRVNGGVSTYIFDKDAACFICTNNVDELVIRTMVTNAIDELLEVTLNTALESKIPQVVKDTIENTILYGGDATPYDD